MVVPHQSKARDGRKHRTVQPDIQILHPDIRGGEKITLHNHREADQNNPQ